MEPANLDPADPGSARTAPQTVRRASVAALVSVAVVAVAIGLAFLPGDPDDSGAGADEDDTTTVDYAFTAYETTEGLLADYPGQPLVVNFFASWCAPCRAELPDLVDAHREFGDEVAFVGIDYLDPVREEAIALLQEAGVTYDIAEDPNGVILDELSGLPAMPTTIFIDRNGTVTTRHRGIILPDELRTEIENLL